MQHYNPKPGETINHITGWKRVRYELELNPSGEVVRPIYKDEYLPINVNNIGDLWVRNKQFVWINKSFDERNVQERL